MMVLNSIPVAAADRDFTRFENYTLCGGLMKNKVEDLTIIGIPDDIEAARAIYQQLRKKAFDEGKAHGLEPDHVAQSIDDAGLYVRVLMRREDELGDDYDGYRERFLDHCSKVADGVDGAEDRKY